jgi:hypothetical protein
MAKKKRSASKKKVARRKKSPAKRKPAPRSMARRKKSAGKKSTGKKSAGKKSAGKKSAGKKSARKKTTRRPATRRTRSSARSAVTPRSTTRGLGPEAAGQSGDTEGLSRVALADSESVEELLEEGQAFEAGVISGVENAPDADKGGVRTRQVPEDDVPQEYLDED